MATKTLTITVDAYEILKRQKRGDESFSAVIRRIGVDRGNIVKKYFGILKKNEEETKETLNSIKLWREEFTKEGQERQERFSKIR